MRGRSVGGSKKQFSSALKMLLQSVGSPSQHVRIEMRARNKRFTELLLHTTFLHLSSQRRISH